MRGNLMMMMTGAAFIAAFFAQVAPAQQTAPTKAPPKAPAAKGQAAKGQSAKATPAPIPPGDWPMYSRDLTSSRYSPSSRSPLPT